MENINYGKNYDEWKGWDKTEFGELTKNESRQFDKILNKSTLYPFKNTNLNALEIGFGNGSFLQYARLNKWNIVGTEVNKELIIRAINKNFNVINTTDLNIFKEDEFDLIAVFDVIEHIEKKELKNFFHSINKILKTGGILICRCPNGDSPFGLPYQNGDITHISHIGTGILKFIANVCNFNIIYLGRNIQSYYSANKFKSLYFLFISLINKIGDFIVMNIFYVGSNVHFFSPNIICILKKNN